MRSIRISKYDIEQLSDILVERSEEKNRRKASHEQLKKVGDQLYNHIYPKKDRDLMDSLPHNWMPEFDLLKVCIGGKITVIPMTKNRRFPYQNDRYNSVVRASFQAREAITEKVSRAQCQYKDACDAVKDLRHRVKAVIEYSRTTKQLVEAWPECEKVVEDYFGSRVSSSATAIVRRDDVKQWNKSMGLPPKGEQAA